MSDNDDQYARIAQEAEMRLQQIPSHQLGPAGRILLTNPRSPAKRVSHDGLHAFDGEKAEASEFRQDPLLQRVVEDP